MATGVRSGVAQVSDIRSLGKSVGVMALVAVILSSTVAEVVASVAGEVALDDARPLLFLFILFVTRLHHEPLLPGSMADCVADGPVVNDIVNGWEAIRSVCQEARPKSESAAHQQKQQRRQQQQKHSRPSASMLGGAETERSKIFHVGCC